MATTATRRTRRTVKTDDKPVVKPRVKTQKRDQDSVTITMQRGKRDRQSREIMPNEPTAGGGVRFEEIADSGRSPVYLTQEDDAALGKPSKIRVTVKAL
jgi:hypothetical protein